MLFLPPLRSTTHSTQSWEHFRGKLIWNKLPSSIKSGKVIVEFKTNLKQLRNLFLLYVFIIIIIIIIILIDRYFPGILLTKGSY